MGLMGQQHVKTDHNLLENLEAYVVLCVDIDPTKPVSFSSFFFHISDPVCPPSCLNLHILNERTATYLFLK